VTTLQSNQLRGLVSATLRDYLSFFRQHPGVAVVDPQQNDLQCSVPPVFETELILVTGETLNAFAWKCTWRPTLHQQ
jgi:hypothetical protein